MEHKGKVMPIDKKSMRLGCLKTVFGQYHAALCFFAERLVQDSMEAEDIVGDVFIKLWQKDPDFGSYKNIKALLYISVKNACFDHLKKRRRDNNKLNNFTYTLLQETEGFALLEMVRSEVLRELHQAMQALPPERRTVMQLTFVEGWEQARIAGHLGISAHTVKKHRLRGVKDLRETLGTPALLPLLPLLHATF